MDLLLPDAVLALADWHKSAKRLTPRDKVTLYPEQVTRSVIYNDRRFYLASVEPKGTFHT